MEFLRAQSDVTIQMTEEVPETEENHPAVLILTRLLESDQITAETHKSLLAKFTKLHDAFVQSCTTEQTLLRRTRELNKELKAQKLTIQNSAAQQQEHRQTLTALRQYVTNIQQELDATREQIEATQANTALKKKEKEKLAAKVEKARDNQQLKTEPEKRQIQVEIQGLEEAIAQRRQNIDGLKATAANIQERMAKCDETLAGIEKSKRAADQKMLEISSIPVKTRQKSSAVEASHNTLLSEEKSLNQQMATAEATLQQLQTESHDLETEYQHVTNDIEGLHQALMDMRLKSEDMRQKCADKAGEKQKYEYEARRIEKMIAEQNKEITQLDTKIENIGKDILKKDRESQKLDETMSRLQLDTATLGSQLKTLETEQTKEEARNAGLKKQLSEAIAAREAALKAILAVEKVNQRVMEDIKKAVTEKDRRQGIHDELANKERELQVQLTEASLIRNRKAREMAGMKKKTIDAKALAMEKNLDYMDLCRRKEENEVKLREVSEMYEKVKLDRNKNVNHIQTSKQLIVEYKEKIKILENEVEVLRGEFESVELAVKLQKNDLNEAFKRRDATKTDLKRQEMAYKDLQSKIDLQMNETNRMNTILQNLEDQIQHNQKRYTCQADDCFNIQRMLIDKQDELCLIYEQFNRHEEVMRRGEIALREREEEHKLLTLQLRDFLRQIDVMQRKIPQLKAYDAEIAELESQIDKERQECDAITSKLEVPDLKERKRAYCGKDFTMKELEDKVSLYEQRINSKEQQVWEKQILLREIDDKIAELQATERPDSERAAKICERSGNIRASAMNIRRKKLAALAESAIYQAQSAELEEEKQAAQAELQKAGERTQRGEAFDEYAEKMIKLYQRDVATSKLAKTRSANPWDSDDEDDMKKPGRQHFDAYPTADGLSRPYGAFPVFQPGAPSAQLRHYRKETLRPIEL